MTVRTVNGLLASLCLLAAAGFAEEPVRVALISGEGDRAPKAGMTELLTAELSKLDGVAVLEREEVRRILTEQKLSAAGLTDRAASVRLGAVMRADALLVLERLGPRTGLNSTASRPSRPALALRRATGFSTPRSWSKRRRSRPPVSVRLWRGSARRTSAGGILRCSATRRNNGDRIWRTSRPRLGHWWNTGSPWRQTSWWWIGSIFAASRRRRNSREANSDWLCPPTWSRDTSGRWDRRRMMWTFKRSSILCAARRISPPSVPRSCQQRAVDRQRRRQRHPPAD